MACQFCLGHLEIAEFVPKIFSSIQTNESGGEETDPFDTAHTADAYTGQEKPNKPFRRETLVPESMESCPAQDGSEGKAEEHGIEEDETRDRCVGVLAEHHECDEPDSWTSEAQFASGEVGQRYCDCAKKGVEYSHKGIVDFFRILLAGLEFERTIVTSQIARQANQHLPEGRVDVEVELAFEIV